MELAKNKNPSREGIFNTIQLKEKEEEEEVKEYTS
jgi:hypothetical protein